MPALTSQGGGSTSPYSSSSMGFLVSAAPGLGARHSISRTFLPPASVMVSLATSFSPRLDLREKLMDAPYGGFFPVVGTYSMAAGGDTSLKRYAPPGANTRDL